jgi:hemolysin-activating ACP:hemolysin acyltransferase
MDDVTSDTAILAQRLNCLEEAVQKIDLCYLSLSSGPLGGDQQLPAGIDPMQLLTNILAVAAPVCNARLADLRARLELVSAHGNEGSASTSMLPDGGVRITMALPETWAGLVLLMHEVAHALHMQSQSFAQAPTLWREVVAFVAELVLLDHLSGAGLLDKDVCTNIEHAFNALYLGPHNRKLQQLLAAGGVPSHDFYYPLARLSALHMRRSLGPHDLPKLFDTAPDDFDMIVGNAIQFADTLLQSIAEHCQVADQKQRLGLAIFQSFADTGPELSVAAAAVRHLGVDFIAYVQACDATAPVRPTAPGELFAWRRVFAELPDALAIYAGSRLHVDLPFRTFFRHRVLPALLLRQCVVFGGPPQGPPSCILTWALLSDEAFSRCLEIDAQPGPHEWRSGSHAFFTDLHASRTDLRRAIRHIRQMPLLEQSSDACLILRSAEGSPTRIVQQSRNGRRTIRWKDKTW